MINLQLKVQARLVAHELKNCTSSYFDWHLLASLISHIYSLDLESSLRLRHGEAMMAEIGEGHWMLILDGHAGTSGIYRCSNQHGQS